MYKHLGKQMKDKDETMMHKISIQKYQKFVRN